MKSNNETAFPTSNNVITFPRAKIKNDETPSLEEIKENVETLKHFHIQEVIANIAPMLFNQLDISGFTDLEEQDMDMRDGALIIEAIRSLMCKHYGMYHQFQRISESIFKIDENDPTTLKIVDDLKINFKKSE